MKHIADWALNVATQRGASFADARVVDERSRGLATKNGKASHASDAESLGIGIRVIADGAWGFAAGDDLSRPAVEETARPCLRYRQSVGPRETGRYSPRAGETGNRRLGDALPDRSILASPSNRIWICS